MRTGNGKLIVPNSSPGSKYAANGNRMSLEEMRSLVSERAGEIENG